MLKVSEVNNKMAENKMTEIGKATPSGERNYKPLKDQIAQLKKALKITQEGASKEVAKTWRRR